MTVSCPVCGAATGSVFKKTEGVVLLRCAECALVFIPRESYHSDPASQYRNDQTSPTSYYALTAATDQNNFVRTLSEIERFMAPGTILDVGASIGSFLDAARERKWKGVGIEPNPRAVLIARRNKLEVHEGFLDAVAVRELRAMHPQGFDAIHMGDVIEHVFDPLAFLRFARSLMKPGGVIAVVTPDIERMLARKYQIKPREHLVYFNTRSLTRALEATGFEMIEIKGQARVRDVRNIPYGTAKLSSLERAVAVLAQSSVVAALVNMVFRILKDELIALARVKA